MFGKTPYLTTREAFVLKSAPGAGERAAYLAKTSDEKNSILNAVDKMALPAIQDLVPDPTLSIEWHYSVRQLCQLMGRVADLPLMSINPGPADATLFRSVAFKGGSDTGAQNVTTQLQTKRGSSICISATVNDPTKALDGSVFESAYSAVIRALAEK